MGRIEWAMWANEQGVLSSWILFVGGLLSVSSLALEMKHKFWEIGIIGMAVGLLVFLIEYPRGKRQKGNTQQRFCQYLVTNMVSCMGFFGRNYFVRFILYFLFCLPCLLNLGTIMGGVCLLVTSFIYLRAAVSGEHWTPCERLVTREKTLTRARPPSMAPPRVKKNEAYDPENGEVYTNSAGLS